MMVARWVGPVVLLAVLATAAGLTHPWQNAIYTEESNIGCGTPDETVAPVLPASLFDTPGQTSEESKDVDEDLSDIARTSDFGLDARDLHRSDCVMAWAQFWNTEAAFQCDNTRAVDENGNDPSGTRYWRTLFTSGTATAFLKAANGAVSLAASTNMVAAQPWFQMLQDCNRNWTEQPLQDWAGVTGVTDNPHFAAYPGLLSILLTSIILEDTTTFAWAATELNNALDTVTDDGLAANAQSNDVEVLLEQSTGILNYAIPAAILVHANAAEVGVRDTATHPGLARMAWRTAHGMQDSSFFTQRFGVLQVAVDCAQGDTWPWLYATMLEGSSESSAAVAVSRQAAANLSITYDIGGLKGLVNRCEPEDTFDKTTGGRSCWWDPTTFYSSPCVGWTNGPIISAAIAATVVGMLVIFCVCFLCNWKTAFSCMVSSPKNRHPEQSKPLKSRQRRGSDASHGSHDSHASVPSRAGAAKPTTGDAARETKPVNHQAASFNISADSVA